MTYFQNSAPPGTERPAPPQNRPGGFSVRCPNCSHIVNTRFCTFCGTDLSAYFPYAVPPQSPPPLVRKNHVLRNILIGVAAAAACITFFAVYFQFLRQRQAYVAFGGQDIAPAPGMEDYYYPSGISAEEYRQIEIGMSYARVSAIIGGDGEIVESSQTLKEEIYYTYVWYGEENPYAAAYITFTDGAVTAMENEGITHE